MASLEQDTDSRKSHAFSANRRESHDPKLKHKKHYVVIK